MDAAKFYKSKTPTDRKKGSNFTIEFPLPVSMVKTFCSEKWIKDTSNKYVRKIKFSLVMTDTKVEDQQIVMFIVSGKHKASVLDVGNAMVARYNKMITVIKNITSNKQE